MDSAAQFFNECVDLDNDHTYSGAFDQDELKPDILGPTAPQPLVVPAGEVPPYASTDPSLIATPHSLNPSPIMSFQDDPYNPSLCDPALLASTGAMARQAARGREPLTPSSTAATTRGSVTTRSSSNSVHHVQPTKPTVAAVADAPLESDPPKKRKAGRRTRKSSAAEEDGKRKIFLEKNRIAASKCRQKKKEYVHELEEAKAGLEQQNSNLQLEYHSLLNEVSQMKNQLMSHADCKDANIDRWIEIEARKFVQISADRAAADPALLIRGRPGSIGSGHSLADTEGKSSSPRRHSMTYSSASSLQASPLDVSFPQFPVSPKLKAQPSVNLDHMPDSMFD